MKGTSEKGTGVKMILKDRVALVTGAGRGIGRAIALAFAREGAHLVIVSRTPAELQQVAEEIAQIGSQALAIPADVSQPEEIQAMVQATQTLFGRVDILVNNAGIGTFCKTWEMPVEEWDHILAVNLRGPFLCCKAVLPGMIERDYGRIINISSMAGLRAWPDYGPYSASKAGLNLFTQVLAEELKAIGKKGITVNALCPGPVATRLRSSHFPEEDPSTIMQPKRVAEVALFLASEASQGISGAIIPVNHY